MPTSLTKTLAKTFGGLAAAGLFFAFVASPSQALEILKGEPQVTAKTVALPPIQCKKPGSLLKGVKTHYARYNACNVELGQ